MNISTKQHSSSFATGLLPIAIIAVGLVLGAGSSAWAGHGNQGNPGILPPQSQPYGKSYPEWAAAFWQWSLALPVSGHPFLDDNPIYDFGAGQSGKVWFWSAPDATLTRHASMPAGTAMFLTIRDAECSSLEAVDSGFYGATEQEQRACATYWSDHIVDVFCVIDGVAVQNLEAYRFTTPQFQFAAPTPWIFGDTGGTGTSVGNGYFLMLAPLSRGTHVIHYGGNFHFSVAEGDDFDADFPKDITIILTVE